MAFLALWVGGVSCQSEEAAIPAPTNLTLELTASEDGSGKVAIKAEADGASYYMFTFGEDEGLAPFRDNDGSVFYIYKESGTYEVTVAAHASEQAFTTLSEMVTVEIFIQIPETGYSTPLTYDGMTLIWSDEFDGASSALDPTKWTHEQGDGCPNVCGWGNNELEYYQAENTTVTEGVAIIEARNENKGGRYYTSSRVITRDNFNFKYGRVDVRAALPKGQGIWPAIWMLGKSIGSVGWPKCGEIDIMEMIGGAGREKTVHGTAHWNHDPNNSHASYGGHYDLTTGTFADEFHVFTIIWTDTAITWYVDDIQFHVIAITRPELSEFKEEFFLLMNVAVGGNWPGNPDGTTSFPQRMFVDYIRVFQQN